MSQKWLDWTMKTNDDILSPVGSSKRGNDEEE
jgi:hypothetical protein